MLTLPFVALFLSVILTTFNFGFFTWAGLAVSICLFTILLYCFVIPENFPQKIFSVNPGIDPLVSYIFVTIYVLSLFFPTGIYHEHQLPALLAKTLPILSLPLALTYLRRSDGKGSDLSSRFMFFIVVALTVRILVVIASPRPSIDVFYTLKEAPAKLLAGVNPYDSIYTNVYQGTSANYYAYFPAAILLQLPFIIVFNDPRVLLIIADIAAGLLLYDLGNKTSVAKVLTLVYLFRPNSTFIIEQSWLTPLVFFLSVAIFARIRCKYFFHAGILSGLLACVQPLHVIVGIMTFFIAAKKRAFAYASFVTASIVVVPFLLMNSQSFIDQTVGVYFRNPKEILSIPLYRSLNVNTAFYQVTGHDIPLALSLSIISLLGVWLVWKVRRNRSLTNTVLGLVVFYSGFYLLFRQAFINYYYLLTGLILLWITVSIKYRTYNIKQETVNNKH